MKSFTGSGKPAVSYQSLKKADYPHSTRFLPIPLSADISSSFVHAVYAIINMKQNIRKELTMRTVFKASISFTVLTALLITAPAFAKGKRHVDYEYAPVISAKPITRIEKRSEPYKDCWTEEVLVQDEYYSSPRRVQRYSGPFVGDNSYTGPILGAVIGGGIGNAVGHSKTNKKVGAVVGSLLGGAIGHDLTRNRPPDYYYEEGYYNPPRYEERKRCETRYETYSEEKVIGYRVKYRYNGEVYSTRTRHDPGSSIRLRVTASPVDD
jgi:uncharacterized protein YcfJ